MQSVLQYRSFRRRIQEQIESKKGISIDTQHGRGTVASGPGRLPPEDASSSEPSSSEPEKADPNADRMDSQSRLETRIESHADEKLDEKWQRRHSSSVESVESVETAPPPTQESTTRPAGGLQSLNGASTRSIRTLGTALGQSLTGIDVRDRTTNEGGKEERQVFVVGFEGPDDPMNPHNWSNLKRIRATLHVASIGAVVGMASSIDSSALKEAAEEFGVSEVAESLATCMYLVGFGCGGLVSGPFSETLGRNPVYLTTLSLYMIFIMASGLAPNIGAQIIFRFLAGLFGATPLVCAGGSVADLWTPLERVYAFPIFANAAFSGPVLGPVLGGYIVESTLISWRWTEWITLITSGLVLFGVFFFQPETYAGTLLKWKSEHLREFTGDDRYVSPIEIRQESLGRRLLRALYRPFLMTAQEPIIILISLYLTIIYIVLFTFLDGYDFIFGQIHGTSVGVTGLCFVGIEIGLCGCTALVPLIYKWAKRDLRQIQERGGTKLPPEFRLWFAMLGGSVALPVSLFWMGWTSYPHISIWSPLIASVLFGYGILCVFISSYQYIIDSYETYSASALGFVTVIRYIVSGGMVTAALPIYEKLGVHYTLTILACISAAMVPLPYVFYKYGPWIRTKSKFAMSAT